MHIGFVPFHTTTVNDILWLDDSMRALLNFIRLRGPKAGDCWKACSHCQRETLVEYHHVRPLWSVATEAILKMHPTSFEDLSAIRREINRGDLNRIAMGVPGQVVRLWGAHDEIVPLCCKCHDSETKKTNAEWKAKLSQRYPTLWSYRFERKEFIAVVEKWYMKEAA